MLRLAALLAILAILMLCPGPAAALVPGLDHAIDGATDNLLDKGVLGTVSVIGLMATAVLAWRYAVLSGARLADSQAGGKELVQVNKESTEALRVNAEAMMRLAATVEASTRGADERWRTLGDLLAALTPIQTGIASNGSALGRMEADLRELNREARR